MRIRVALALIICGGVAVGVYAMQRPAPVGRDINPVRVDAALKAAFALAPAEWAQRLDQDATMKACTEHRNKPPKEVADQIVARERAAIRYPDDGKLIGDWRKGEQIAQSGYGMRFTDYPAANPNGGNCYACHQLSGQEVSFGTVGVNLRDYGKNRKFREADTKAVYEKIYNSQVAFPCSVMPRFGSNRLLSIQQITHLVALLMDPDSPVNK